MAKPSPVGLPPHGKGKLRRTKSAEDFALAFGDVELHLEGPDDTTPLAGPGPDYEELADFSEYWANSGLPPKDPAMKARWHKLSAQQQQQHHQHALHQQPLALRSMLSGATSPTEAGTDTGTHASESWAGTTAADDIVSTLSNDTDDCDTASRSSVKRRRTQNSSSSFGFQPLAQVKESAVDAGNGENEPDVRPWKVDIPDHDVVLGDTHEPTWGTKIYREIRKPYAKKTITNEQLKHVKQEFQERLEKELGKKLPCLPRFWCNKELRAKTKQIPVSGFLKNRPGITYAYAKDEAIRDDIKNASARPRTRMLKLFTFKGTLDEVIEKALEACDAWVGEDIDKELYAKGFKEDISRMAPWRAEYVEKKEYCEQKAMCESVMRRTHMREASIHESHASHLEIAMVEMINQLGNLMIEAHRTDTRKSGKSSGMDSGSVDEGSVGAPLCPKTRSLLPPEPRRVSSSSAGKGARKAALGSTKATTITSNVTSKKKKQPANGGKEPTVSSSSAFRPPLNIQDMDLSPIDVRKTVSMDMHETKPSADAITAKEAAARKDLSSMFSQTLRMGSMEDVGAGGGSNMLPPGNVAVVMPPGLPREVRPGGPADELSVLSTPDDLSVLFMEARESAIRRGIDHPGALPQPGQVADRTKALLQQMKNRSDSKQGAK
ncbi:hypothetical protein ACA910_003202 [Epithemia clementina (nom. ined.)]